MGNVRQRERERDVRETVALAGQEWRAQQPGQTKCGEDAAHIEMTRKVRGIGGEG